MDNHYHWLLRTPNPGVHFTLMGNAKSGERAATFYTLIGNCHRQKINAEAYLTDMLTRLASSATTKTVEQLNPPRLGQRKNPPPRQRKNPSRKPRPRNRATQVKQ
jgi:hypothetical protein